jgi:hypothetical protein
MQAYSGDYHWMDVIDQLPISTYLATGIISALIE